MEAIRNRLQNQEEIILICLDSNDEFGDYFECLKDHQRPQTSDSIILQTEIQCCIHFIQSIENERIFFITSSSSASQILPLFRTFQQLPVVFVFSSNQDEYEYLMLTHSNIIGIYDKFDLLCTAIQEQLDLIDKQSYLWTFFDQDGYLTRDLSKQFSSFLWLHLLRDVLQHFPRDHLSKQQMFDTCRDYYRNDSEVLASIGQFELDYDAKRAMDWYEKNAFLRKMINKALQTENTNQLYSLRYFLSDLIENLADAQQQSVRVNNERMVVYRTMQISKNELNILKENTGKLTAIKELLMASRHCSSELPYSAQSKISDERVFVSFEIQCDDNVTLFGESSTEEQVIFDLSTTFRLDSVEQNEHFYVIQMTVVNDGKKIAEKYIEDTHRQIENLSIPIIFGQLLSDMTQWDQSQTYFEHLLSDPHDEDLAWIEHNLGQAYHWKRNWLEAQNHYDQAYERMINNGRVQDSAEVLSKLGELLHLQGKYEQAYDYHQRALNIRKEYFPLDHATIATSLDNIGLVYYEQLKYTKALEFLRESLQRRENYFNAFHVDIASNLNNIGSVLTNQDKCDEALQYHERAMSIFEKCYPSDHVFIAITLNKISAVLHRKGKFDEALHLTRRAWTIQRKSYTFNHNETLTSLNIIGNIMYQQGKCNLSLDFHQQIYNIKIKFYSSDHLNTAACTLNTMAYINFYGLNNCEKALGFYQRSLQLQEASYPSYLGHITQTLIFIGHILRKQEKYIEALRTYEQVLSKQQDYYSPDDVRIAHTYRDIGNILDNQKEYEKALVHHQQSLAIYEKTDLANHKFQIITLFNIGKSFSHLGKDDQAFEHYQTALNLQRECCATDNFYTVNILNNMGIIWFNRKNYEEAIYFYLQALVIYEKQTPLLHQNIVIVLENIASSYNRQKKYDEALEYYQRGLDIQQEHCSSNHSQIANTYHRLGNILSDQAEYKEAIVYYQQALTIYEEHCETQQNSLANVLENIGLAFYRNYKYSKARKYQQRALEIYEEQCPSRLDDMAKMLRFIGNTFLYQRKYNRSLDCYIRALSLYKDHDPMNHIRIADCLQYLGYICCSYQLDYTGGTRCYEICLRVLEASLDGKHPAIADILSCLSGLQRVGNRHELALVYALKCLLIRERCFPPNHINIGESLSNIGECYDCLRQLKLALDYFKRAFVIYEQCLSSADDEWSWLKRKIEQLSEEIKNT